MSVTVRIPTPLRSLTAGEEQVSAEGDTVRAVIDDLESNHPGIRERLLDDKGIRRFVNVYLGVRISNIIHWCMLGYVVLIAYEAWLLRYAVVSGVL